MQTTYLYRGYKESQIMLILLSYPTHHVGSVAGADILVLTRAKFMAYASLAEVYFNNVRRILIGS